MAPVKAVYGFRIKPGRFEEWRSMSREGDKLVTRLGGGQVRSMLPIAAGSQSELAYSTIDFANAEAWGTFLDTTDREVEAQVFLERMFGHLDSPAEMVSSSLITEIPLGIETQEMQNGPVLDTFVTMPKPGRVLDSVQFAAEVAPKLLGSAARAVHLYQVGPAGPESGGHAFVTEYESYAAFGRMQDASETPDWVEVMQRVTAPDAPFTIVQRTLMREVLTQ